MDFCSFMTFFCCLLVHVCKVFPRFARWLFWMKLFAWEQLRPSWALLVIEFDGCTWKEITRRCFPIGWFYFSLPIYGPMIIECLIHASWWPFAVCYISFSKTWFYDIFFKLSKFFSSLSSSSESARLASEQSSASTFSDYLTSYFCIAIFSSLTSKFSLSADPCSSIWLAPTIPSPMFANLSGLIPYTKTPVSKGVCKFCLPG